MGLAAKWCFGNKVISQLPPFPGHPSPPAPAPSFGQEHIRTDAVIPGPHARRTGALVLVSSPRAILPWTLDEGREVFEAHLWEVMMFSWMSAVAPGSWLPTREGAPFPTPWHLGRRQRPGRRK